MTPGSLDVSLQIWICSPKCNPPWTLPSPLPLVCMHVMLHVRRMYVIQSQSGIEQWYEALHSWASSAE